MSAVKDQWHINNLSYKTLKQLESSLHWYDRSKDIAQNARIIELIANLLTL